jgi:hypothetical protein
MVNERAWLAVIFSFYFLLAIGYSLLMPMWEGPDEPAHYLVALTLARMDRYATPEKNYEAHQPQGFYRFAALVIKGLDKLDKRYSDYFRPYPYYRFIRQPIRIFDWKEANYRFLVGAHILRWLNILIGGGALWLNWSAFRLISPGEPTQRLAAIALGALTPQYLHIMSSISNDALGALAGALLFSLAVRISLGASPRIMLLSVILAFILPLLTKLTVLPVGVVLVYAVVWKHVSHTQRFWRWLLGGLLALFFSFTVVYLISPTTVLSAIDQLQWRALSIRDEAYTSAYLVSMISQVIWSYWGKVGWLAVGLPGWMVVVFTLFGLLGGFIQARKLVWLRSGRPHFAAWIVVWSVALLSIAAVLRNGLTTPHSQGRFLFPALGALTLLMASGWHAILPERFQPMLPWILILVMLAANFFLWGTGILPVYYQPFLD